MHELVRPLGTDIVSCPSCGAEAERSHVHHFDVVGSTVDTRGDTRRFIEATAEMEHGYNRVEAETGERVQRPDVWSPVEARVRAKLKHGELDMKAFPPREGGALKNVRLSSG